MGSTYSAAGVSLSGSPIMGEAQMFIPSQPSGPDCETVAGAGRPCVAAELTGTPAATTGVRLSPTENDLLSKIRSQRNGAWLGPIKGARLRAAVRLAELGLIEYELLPGGRAMGNWFRARSPVAVDTTTPPGVVPGYPQSPWICPSTRRVERSILANGADGGTGWGPAAAPLARRANSFTNSDLDHTLIGPPIAGARGLTCPHFLVTSRTVPMVARNTALIGVELLTGLA